MSANEDIRVGFRADSSDVDRALDKTKKKAKETERAVNRATGGSRTVVNGGGSDKIPGGGAGTGAQIAGGLRAGGLGPMAEKAGNVSQLSELGGGAAALGALTAVINLMTTAYNEYRKSVLEAAAAESKKTDEMLRALDAQKQQHEEQQKYAQILTDLSHVERLSNAQMIQAERALDKLGSSYRSLGVEIDYVSRKIKDADQAQAALLEKQKAQRIKELERALRQATVDRAAQQNIMDTAGWRISETPILRVFAPVVQGLSTLKGNGDEITLGGEAEAMAAAEKVAQLGSTMDTLRRQILELKKTNPGRDLLNDQEAARQDKIEADQQTLSRMNEELAVQLELHKKIAEGRGDEADELRLLNELKARNIDTDSEAAKKSIAAILQQRKALRELNKEQEKRREAENKKEQAENQQKNFNDSLLRQAEDLKFAARAAAGDIKGAAIDRALRDARERKGSELTPEEKARVTLLTELKYRLQYLPQLNLGDISTKTNALTARGGFASGIVRPQADRVNNQIMLNTQATNRLIQTVIGEIQKLGRI